jgi:hypothetical protein
VGPHQQTEEGLLGLRSSGRGRRRQDRDFEIGPDRIQSLAVGEAVVVTPGAGPPRLASVFHPKGMHGE